MSRRGLEWISGALTVACLVLPHPAVAAAADSLLQIEALLERYDTGILRTRSLIESLSVNQIMIEPQKSGVSKRATAVLTYVSGEGMTREEFSSELSYPAGEYTLESLTGPELGTDEYSLTLSGTEEMKETLCYRIEVEAVSRDMHHFDGTIWISVADQGPVRIVGEVADPPFPVMEITLDKSFGPHGDGMRLLTRHSGEVEVNLILGRKRGLRHISYEDYLITLIE